MKKTYMRFLAFLLLSAMVCAAIISCKDESANDSESYGASDSESLNAVTDGISEENEASNEDEFGDRQSAGDSIGTYDFTGEEFTVVLSTMQMQEPYFAEEEIGSPINDAVYRRNLEIEERFNVDLILFDTGGDWSEVADAIGKSVAAGSGDYDLGLSHTFTGLTGLVGGGYLYDWNQIPVVDMSNPWWNKNVKDKLTINGQLFVASSDLIYQRPGVIYFNKEIIQDFALDNPYALVKSGDWTWDRLTQMAKTVSADINGDGEYGKEDRYGYAHWLNWQTPPVIHSNGLFLTETDSDGYPRYTPLMSEKMQTVFEKYYDLIYTENKTYLIKEDEILATIGSYTPLFENGQILFLHSNTELLKRFTGLEIDFGMIPLPKYDSLQENYHTMSDTQMMVIPSDVDNTEMCGVISEALSAYSYRYVVPAVYDVMYANRYLRDDESYEMFNLIMKGLVYEFSWTFGEGNSMTYALPNLMNEKSTNISSFYERNAPAAEKALANFIDKVLDLQN